MNYDKKEHKCKEKKCKCVCLPSGPNLGSPPENPEVYQAVVRSSLNPTGSKFVPLNYSVDGNRVSVSGQFTISSPFTSPEKGSQYFEVSVSLPSGYPANGEIPSVNAIANSGGNTTQMSGSLASGSTSIILYSVLLIPTPSVDINIRMISYNWSPPSLSPVRSYLSVVNLKTLASQSVDKLLYYTTNSGNVNVYGQFQIAATNVDEKSTQTFDLVISLPPSYPLKSLKGYAVTAHNLGTGEKVALKNSSWGTSSLIFTGKITVEPPQIFIFFRVSMIYITNA